MFDMYNLPVWATEHKCGNYPWNPAGYPAYNATAAPNDQAYAVESWGYIRDAIKAGVTAYNAWNMVLDTVGLGNDTVRDWTQNALLTVNTSSKTLTLTPTYHVFRHVSQYVKPTAQGRRDERQHRRDRVQEPGRQRRRRHVQPGRRKRDVQRADQGQRYQFSMPSSWAGRPSSSRDPSLARTGPGR